MKDTLMIIRLKEKFESIFRYDNNGLPKVWKPGDDIDGQFQHSLNESYKLCDLFNRIDIPIKKIKEVTELDNIDEDSLVIIETSKKKMLLNRFRNTVEILYIDAKHSVVSTTSEIPIWMFIVIIVLGWNEFMAVLRNPIYFLLVVIGLVTAYALYRTNMIQPLLKIIRSILRDIGHQIVEKITSIENQNIINERYEMYKKNYPTLHFPDEFDDNDKIKGNSDFCLNTNSSHPRPTLVQSSSLSHLAESVHFIDNTEELNKQYEMNVNQIKRNKLLKRHTFQVPLNTKPYDDDDDDETDTFSYEMENLGKYDANNSENRYSAMRNKQRRASVSTTESNDFVDAHQL